MGKVLCALFGHRPEGPGWWGDVPYMRIRQGGTDNIGRIHGYCEHECRRCGKTYTAGRIHLNDAVILKALRWPEPGP